jgi:hypothetical protein
MLLAGAAFASLALLTVLQTVLLQIIPYDSPALGTVSTVLRVLTLVVDAALFVSFVAFARRARPHAGLFAIAAALTAYGIVGELAWLAAKVLGNGAFTLRATGAAMGAAEPVLSLGAALLFVLALSALSKDASKREEILLVAVAASVAFSLVFKAYRAVDHTAASLPMAWLSWAVDVARPAAIGFVALGRARALALLASTSAGVATAGPYRAAAEGAPKPEPTELLDDATERRVREAARGLSAYRSVFLLRIVATVVTLPFLLISASDSGPRVAALAAAVMTSTSLVTALLMARGLRRFASLPRASHARPASVAALVAVLLVAVADVATLLYGAYTFTSPSHRMLRRFADAGALETLLAILLLGVAMIFLASAVRRAAETIDAGELVARAGWSQGVSVASAALGLGAPFAISVRFLGHDDGRTAVFVLLAMLLGAFVLAIASVVLHVKVAGQGHVALILYAAARSDDGER